MTYNLYVATESLHILIQMDFVIFSFIMFIKDLDIFLIPANDVSNLSCS